MNVSIQSFNPLTPHDYYGPFTVEPTTTYEELIRMHPEYTAEVEAKYPLKYVRVYAPDEETEITTKTQSLEDFGVPNDELIKMSLWSDAEIYFTERWGSYDNYRRMRWLEYV